MSHQRQVLIASRLIKNRLRHKAVANPLKVVWIDPSKLQHFGRIGTTWESVGEIKGGAWDQDISELKFRWGRERPEWVSRNLSELPKPQAVRERFIEEKDWEETGIYDFYEHMIARHGRFDGCTQLEDVEARLSSIDCLYQSMKEDGYDPSHHETLSPKWWKKSHLTAMDFPRVNIGRDGEFLFTGGAWHRLMIAKVLETEKIPCWILCRHFDWQQTRNSIKANHKINGGMIESHPDLQDLV